MLPPLTFYEFLSFIEEDDKLIRVGPEGEYHARDINELNDRFLDYLNYGWGIQRRF
jgi:uncharacterized protein